MTVQLPTDLDDDLRRSGYFPQIAAGCLARALRGAAVIGHLVRPETTFEGAEVRRHLTVLALTARHLIVAHLDDDPADELNPSQVQVTTERVRLTRIASVGLSQTFDSETTAAPAREAEVTLGISWGGSRRLELDRAWCDDPECQADHGYNGVLTPSDIALRVSALADGDAEVQAALRFHGELADAVDAAEG